MSERMIVAFVEGETVILHCHHWLPLIRDLHTNLAVVAVIFCQNDSVILG
jgi:hypothetical protein